MSVLLFCLGTGLTAQEAEVTENARLTGLANRIENLIRVAKKLEADGKTEQAARLRERIKTAEEKLAKRKEEIASGKRPGKGKGKPEGNSKPEGSGKSESVAKPGGKGKPEGKGNPVKGKEKNK